MKSAVFADFSVIIGKDWDKAVAEVCTVPDTENGTEWQSGPDRRSDHIFMPHSMMHLVSRAW